MRCIWSMQTNFPNRLSQLKSVISLRGRTLGTLQTSPNVFLILWVPCNTPLILIIITSRKVTTPILVRLGILPVQANNNGLSTNYVIKLDTPLKFVGLDPTFLLHHTGLRQIFSLLRQLASPTRLWTLEPPIISPLIFRICLFTIPMVAMKISSSVTVKAVL